MKGNTTARGYGAEHQRLRAYWAPQVAAGRVVCWRCGEVIRPGEPWDLGHNDADRTKYEGPEHRGRCNRSVGGRKGAEVTNARRARVSRSW